MPTREAKTGRDWRRARDRGLRCAWCGDESSPERNSAFPGPAGKQQHGRRIDESGSGSKGGNGTEA